MRNDTQPKRRSPWKTMLVYALILTNLTLLALAGYFFLWTERTQVDVAETLEPFLSDEGMEQFITRDVSLVRPLKLAEVRQESASLQSLKGSLQSLIQEKKTGGVLTECAVYIQKLDNGEWISLNGNMDFGRNSMLKLAMMLCYLKESEKHPAILDQKYAFSENGSAVPGTKFTSATIKPGQYYTVRQLIEQMIRESDNYANALLGKYCEPKTFRRVFTDVGIPEPRAGDPSFTITARNISKFMRVLYDGTYLSIPNSQYALELLTRTSFMDGLVARLPADQLVAHKFGELEDGERKEFSETGIVYGPKQDYLITVMTRGTDFSALTKTVAEISEMAYGVLEGQ